MPRLTYLNTFSPESSGGVFIGDVCRRWDVADQTFDGVQPVVGRHRDAQTDESRQRAHGGRRA